MIKVVVCGASGRMGQTIGRMVHDAKDMELVGGINLKPGTFFGVDIVETKNMDAFLKDKKPDVLIDFTIAHAAVENVKIAARNNVAVDCRYHRIYCRPAGGDGRCNRRPCACGHLKQFFCGGQYLLADLYAMRENFSRIMISRLSKHTTGTRRMRQAARQRRYCRSSMKKWGHGTSCTGAKV